MHFKYKLGNSNKVEAAVMSCIVSVYYRIKE